LTGRHLGGQKYAQVRRTTIDEKAGGDACFFVGATLTLQSDACGVLRAYTVNADHAA
jgi:hypothetical protein